MTQSKEYKLNQTQRECHSKLLSFCLCCQPTDLLCRFTPQTFACCRFTIRQAAKAVIHTGATNASFSCNGSTLAAWHDAKVDVYSVQALLETGNAVVIFSWEASNMSAIAQVSSTTLITISASPNTSASPFSAGLQTMTMQMTVHPMRCPLGNSQYCSQKEACCKHDQ